MRRAGLSAAVAAVAIALLAAPAQGVDRRRRRSPATVGPGFTITITKGGKAVKTLKPGAYTITVNDKSSIHNFRLKGPGFNKATSVPKSGKTTWNVTLKKGT